MPKQLKSNVSQNQNTDLDYIHPYELAQIHGNEKTNKTKAPSGLSRRAVLGGLGTLGVASFLSGCSKNAWTAAKNETGTNSDTTGGTNGSSCTVIPSETDGPYPLYSARNGLYRNDIIGSDITSSTGIPLQIVLNLQNTNDGCEPIANAAVYVWHCDQYGQYSGYSSSQNGSHAGKTFCRGIQVSDNNGQVTFTTLFPGWYSGRITHVHFAIYLNNDLNLTPKISQFCFPQSVTTAAYLVSPYSIHGQNTSVTSFAADNIFADGTSYQIATVIGSSSTSFVASLNVGVPA